ncbi:MAG TPA: glycosyltransferase 61 family protein [Rhizomicrobium sp.]|jgi:hypothetical protein|nr:glycosyltransferase 61 family protein [Rhizomicrobium sp.]
MPDMTLDAFSQSGELSVEAPGIINGFNRIRFYFFRTIEHIRSRCEGLSIHQEQPAIAEVPGGLVHDLELQFIQHNDAIVGVYDNDNQPVEASVTFRGDPTERGPGKKETRFDGVIRDGRAAYYLGARAAHYGHFLLETLCRAWAWEKYGEGAVPILQHAWYLDFARDLFALVPGLTKRIEVVAAPTRFANITVPFPGFVCAHAAYTEFKAMCMRMAESVLPRSAPMTEQPLFLSRAGLPDLSRRRILGTRRLEEFLERQGFLVIRPETLPVYEQIALFNRHKWIVAPLGSACHTRLFSCRPTNLLMLTKKRFNPNYMLCDQLSEGTAHYGNVFWKPKLGTSAHPGFSEPIVLDEGKLLALLKSFDLVRENATIDGPPPDLASYKRTWIEMARAAITEMAKAAVTENTTTTSLLRDIEVVSASLDK